MNFTFDFGFILKAEIISSMIGFPTISFKEMKSPNIWGCGNEFVSFCLFINILCSGVLVFARF